MSKVLVEIWDQEQKKVIHYIWFNVPGQGGLAVTSKVGTSLHPVNPPLTNYIKMALPAGSTVLETAYVTDISSAPPVDQNQGARLANEGTAYNPAPPPIVFNPQPRIWKGTGLMNVISVGGLNDFPPAVGKIVTLYDGSTKLGKWTMQSGTISAATPGKCGMNGANQLDVSYTDMNSVDISAWGNSHDGLFVTMSYSIGTS